MMIQLSLNSNYLSLGDGDGDLGLYDAFVIVARYITHVPDIMATETELSSKEREQ